MNPSTTKPFFSGTVEKMYFEDLDTGFFIFGTTAKKKVKGYFFHALTVGTKFEVLEGAWETSQKYGTTLVSKRSRVVLAGRTAVAKLYDTLGAPIDKKTFLALGDRGTDIYDDLRDVDALKTVFAKANASGGRALDNAKKVFAAYQSWINYHEVSTALLGLGIPSSKIRQVYLLLGEDALRKIMGNPYILTLDGVLSFLQADRMATRMGMAPDSKERIVALLEYLLESDSKQKGHLYLRPGTLVSALNYLPDKAKIRGYGRELTQDDVDTAVKHGEASGAFVLDSTGLVYTAQNYKVEAGSVPLLKALMETPCSSEALSAIDVDGFIEDFERIYSMSLSESQANAIKLLASNKVTLLTGLPGTGKSTVTRAFVRMFEQHGISYTLLAPTGIAAKRLSAVVGGKAGTIHRTLGANMVGGWRFNEDNPFVTDAVIVDEMSMVDQNLFYRLLVALPPQAVLILVGDPAQLQSVGAGKVLHELIASRVVPRTHLTEIFRQAKASDIVTNSHLINNGEDLVLGDPTDANTDFRFIAEPAPEKVRSVIKALVSRLAKSGRGTYQVISPIYKGPMGVDILNEEIKEMLNPKRKQLEITLRGAAYREGDRIMFVKNNYLHDVYNGEVGKIQRILPAKKEMQIRIFSADTTSRYVTLKHHEVPKYLKLAYALTVHRCQGNEFDYVVIPFHSNFPVLERNLLYTAITRAKKKVFVVGEYKAVRTAVKNQKASRRNTAFASRLREVLPATLSSVDVQTL